MSVAVERFICPTLNPDLEKAASFACRHFVANLGILRILLVKYSLFFLLRLDTHELKIENWGWKKEICGRRMEIGEMRSQWMVNELRIPSYLTNLKSHISLVTNYIILRTLQNFKFYAWGHIPYKSLLPN